MNNRWTTNGDDFTPATDCAFIGAIIGGIIDLIGGAGTAAGLAGSLGLTAADTALTGALGTVGAGIVEGGVEGAGLGALTSAITGGNPLKGAELGGITGGVGGGIEGAFAPTATPGVTVGAGGASTAGTTTGGAALGSAAAPAPSGLATSLAPGSGTGDLSTLGGGGTTPSAVAGSPGVSPTPAPAAPGGLTGLLNQIGIGTDKSDWATPLTAGKLALGAGTAAFDLTRPGIKSIPGYSELTSAAGTLGQQGSQLESYVTTGTLPAGAQASLDQATQSAITQVKSKFAAMGQSGSSQEASEIAAIMQNEPAQAYQIAQGLLSSGIQESSLSQSIYQQILSLNSTADNDTVSAISGLVGALAGGGPTIKLAG